MKREAFYLTMTALLCATMLFGGCRSKKHLTDVENQGADTSAAADTRSRELTLGTIQNANYKTFSCNFNCNIMGFNVNGQARVLHDSIIWVSVNKLFEVGRAMFTPSGVQCYISINNSYFTGDYATLNKRWGIDLDYGTLEALLTGNTLPDSKLSKKAEHTGDSVLFACQAKSRSNGLQRTILYRVGYRNHKIGQTRMTTPSNGQQLQVDYETFQASGKQLFPAKIKVSIRCRRISEQTTVNLSNPTVNPSQSYPFTIPKRAKPL